MSPELEALLRADYERHHCDPSQRGRCHASYERLLADALQKSPGTSRDELLEALRARTLEFRRAQKRIPTIPPQA